MKEMAKIVSGKFATGVDSVTNKAKQGNFSGLTESGDRVFISKDLMKTIGITNDEALFSNGLFKDIFCIFGEQEINTKDADGVATVAKRVSAFSVFTEEDNMIKAFYSSDLRKVRGQGMLAEAAKSAGLTEASFNAIKANAF